VECETGCALDQPRTGDGAVCVGKYLCFLRCRVVSSGYLWAYEWRISVGCKWTRKIYFWSCLSLVHHSKYVIPLPPTPTSSNLMSSSPRQCTKPSASHGRPPSSGSSLSLCCRSRGSYLDTGLQSGNKVASILLWLRNVKY